MLKDNFKKPVLIYKLLKNILVALLIVWFLALLGEAFLPDFISSQFSFLKLILLIFLIIFSIYIVSRKIEIPQTPPPQAQSKIILFISILSMIIISGLALLKFNYFSNITIISSTLLILFYFYKELLSHRD